MSKDIKKMNSMVDLVARSKGTLLAPKELMKRIDVLAPEAVDTLEQLMKSSKADSVRLKASLEILALAGFNKETTLTIKTDTAELQTSEIDQRLSELLGDAAGNILNREKDITPVEEMH
jgi:hypothetical protein